MSEMNEKEIKRRFEEIANYTISSEATARDLERVRRTLIEQSLAPQVTRPTIWRIIMNSRIAKPVAAAAIIIGILLGAIYFDADGTSVAWAEVAAKVQQSRSCKYRISVDYINSDLSDAKQVPKVEMISYVDSEYGTRCEQYMNDKLSGIMYFPTNQEYIVSLMPEAKSYMRFKLNEENLQRMRQKDQDPREMVKLYTAQGYTEIGRSTINGIEVEGIAVDDPKIMGAMFDSFKGQLWVDVKTGWPVKMEYECSMANGDMQMKMVMDDFQWDLELEPSLFEPDIPDDYTLMADTQLPDTKDVDKVIEALRLFSKIADGSYPSSLSMMTVMKEFGETLKRATEAVDAIADETRRAEAKESLKNLLLGFELGNMKKPGEEPSPEQMKQYMKRMMTIQTPAIFYAQLGQEDKDPAYYGDKVTADDANAVLLRWKVSDNEYQVIFGDLTTQFVTAEQLSELEKTLSQ